MIGAVALAIAAPARAQQPPPQPPPAAGAQQPPSARAQQPPAHRDEHAANPAGDQKFVIDAAHANLAEVELGKLAADKASSADVKKFAQQMVDDHTKANDELKTIAQNKNITLPSAIDAKHKAVADKLSKLSGESFDRAYMQEMVNGHRMVANQFRTESKSGKDADVKAWAAKTLPTVEEHLKMAQDANKAVGTSGVKK
jgi:putative membrane protein